MKTLIVFGIIVGLLIFWQSQRKPAPAPVLINTASVPDVSSLISEPETNVVALTPASVPVVLTNLAVSPPNAISSADDATDKVFAIFRLQSEISVPHAIGDVETRDGRRYQQVTVTRIEPDGISIHHASGSGKLGMNLLPPALADKYHIARDTAETYACEINRRKAAAVAEQAERNARYQEEKLREKEVQKAQLDERESIRLADAAERQKAAAVAAWNKYDNDMREYLQKLHDQEMRKLHNRSLIVTRPHKPDPPTVPDYR